MFKSTLAAVLAISVSVLPCPTLAKVEDVGLWMEGTVSNPHVVGELNLSAQKQRRSVPAARCASAPDQV